MRILQRKTIRVVPPGTTGKERGRGNGGGGRNGGGIRRDKGRFLESSTASGKKPERARTDQRAT